MNMCWSGDGNEGIYYSVFELRLNPEFVGKPRCAECSTVINDAVQRGVTDDQLKEILNAKVARKGLKFSNVVEKLKAKWTESSVVVPERPEPEW